MIGPNFIDEIDCGSFFDHIDDLLDFPNEDIDSAALPPPADHCNSFPSLWSDSSLPASDSTDLPTHLSVPYEDIVHLEWLSNFVEDSFSGGSLTINNNRQTTTEEDSSSHNHFRTCSPVSVLESSTSSSGDKTTTTTTLLCNPDTSFGRCGRARTKRPRPATFSPRPSIQPASSFTHLSPPQIQSFIATPKLPPPTCDSAESRLVIRFNSKKKIKFSVDPSPTNNPAVRKCMHCEITKTPQWRAGPMGPKTLCNACGVRYKSGRLFPEYRPAASPTFVPSLHSNSHKKVVEMRSKVGDFATNNIFSGTGN